MMIAVTVSRYDYTPSCGRSGSDVRRSYCRLCARGTVGRTRASSVAIRGVAIRGVAIRGVAIRGVEIRETRTAGSITRRLSSGRTARRRWECLHPGQKSVRTCRRRRPTTRRERNRGFRSGPVAAGSGGGGPAVVVARRSLGRAPSGERATQNSYCRRYAREYCRHPGIYSRRCSRQYQQSAEP